MLTFTAQQLIGGARFTTGIKIGNWNEDIARQEVAAKDYETRRSQGDLLYLRKRKEANFQTATVPLSYSKDGLVRYGYTVQLATGGAAGSGRNLCCNAFMPVFPGAMRTTAGNEESPQARNTVVIQKATGGVKKKSASSSSGAGAGGASSTDEVVRYGDRVVLECNSSLVVDIATKTVGLPYLLHSSMANNVLGNTRKGRQEVVWTTKVDADAEWCVVPANGDRLMLDGEPIHAGDAISLLHCMSNVMLAAVDKETYPTDFGTELDVHCQTHKGINRASMDAGGDLPSSASQPANIWHFTLASDPSAAIDTRGFHPLSPKSLVDRARASLASACGIHGLRSFSLALSALDAKGTGTVPSAGIRLALYEHGVTFTEDEFTLLLGPFERPGAIIPAASFLDALRGGNAYTASATRFEAVSAAYEYLCSTSSTGTPSGVTLAHLVKHFDARWDLRTLAKRMTAEEAKFEFTRQWPQQKGNGVTVSGEAFNSYYRDVSACVADDYEFAEMVFNVWHVPNTGCWKQKKGKRVLVTYHKGSSTEAVIPNGEDISDEDTETMIAALGRMGMGGVARVKVLGHVEVE